jgi:hypothetical protein
MPQRILKSASKARKPILKSRESARERYIAKTGQKGQKGQKDPIYKYLKKSRTGKPSPHTDPKPRKLRNPNDYKRFLDKHTTKKIPKMTPAHAGVERVSKAGKRKAMKKGGPASRDDYLADARKKQPTGRLLADSIKKSKKDKGPNTPGEKQRALKGGKNLWKTFIGKKQQLHYRRRGK